MPCPPFAAFLISTRRQAATAARWACRVLATGAVAGGLVAWPTAVGAQNADAALVDPPGQIARISLVEGTVNVVTPSGDGRARTTQLWSAADLNRPLTAGDRIATGRGARSEMHVGSTAIRLDSLTAFDLDRIDDDALLLRLSEGSLQLRVRTVFDGQRVDISTPNLSFTVTQPGDYRLDVDPAADTTRVVVQSGGGVIYGERATPVPIGAQQQGSFSGTALTLGPPGAALQDSFDAWASARDRAEDRSVTARYVPREVVGYQQLDSHGDWTQDASYGAVWLPRLVPVNWAPYRLGQWRWIAPWGWTWVDDAPWGFAPFHYGRWAQIGTRWGWVPGSLAPRPVYAPALVAFIGGPGTDARWQVTASSLGQPAGLGWFPLAPGEAYRPAYRASPRYLTLINANAVLNPSAAERYRYQRDSSAVTAAAVDDFNRSRAVRGRPSGLSADDLARAPLMTHRFDAIPSFRGAPSTAGTPPLARTINPRREVSPAAERFDPRPAERSEPRPPASLLEADLQARRNQYRLQIEQQRDQQALARQQEAQRQRDNAAIGERALRLQNEQAARISQQQQDAQRLEFQRAQQAQLQSQQQRIQARQQEAIGQQALREQAQQQQESEARIRALQGQRSAVPGSFQSRDLPYGQSAPFGRAGGGRRPGVVD